MATHFDEGFSVGDFNEEFSKEVEIEGHKFNVIAVDCWSYQVGGFVSYKVSLVTWGIPGLPIDIDLFEIRPEDESVLYYNEPPINDDLMFWFNSYMEDNPDDYESYKKGLKYRK